MKPPIYSEKLNEFLTISECHPCGERGHGYWLYDKIQGMNLAMAAPSEKYALVEAITYYQKKYIEIEKELEEIKEKVRSFINSINGDTQEEEEGEE